MEHGKIGHIITPNPLNRLSQNLAWVIMSAISPRTPKFKAIATVGASRQMGEISLSRGLKFLVFSDPNFCLRPETKSLKRFGRLIHRTSVAGYCITRGTKLQNVSVSPIFYAKHPQKGRIHRHFQPCRAKYSKSHIFKTIKVIATKFYTAIKTKYASCVV